MTSGGRPDLDSGWPDDVRRMSGRRSDEDGGRPDDVRRTSFILGITYSAT